MTKYRIHYYNPQGHSKVFRDMFQMAGVEYEDVFHEDSSDKEKMPFGQMPVLEVDGELIPQSGAIHRFLANQFGFAGQTPIEKVWADAYAELFNDFHKDILPWAMAVFHGGQNPDELKKSAYEPGREKYFKFLSNRLKKSKSGFVLDSGISYVDLVFFEASSKMVAFEPGFLGDDFPEVQKYVKKIGEHPKLKPYLETRDK